ncbi:hypothetical protein [Saccharopolyspora sp. MS10]|uniref:hypothetical protein n=1 Tax=Saccharopolyspora sp. MS10 TaxID=3385973 RepID=UPI0039A27612
MSGRHHWRPSGDGIRQAFRRWRWNGKAADVSIRGVRAALTEQLSGTDRVRALSCPGCDAEPHHERNGAS